MFRLTHESGFEWTFATVEEAIAYLETFEHQEEFEIRGQTARSIFTAPGPIPGRIGRQINTKKNIKTP